MAIIKCGGIVTGIRGNLGGNICSANKAGAYARPWASITNRRTYDQTIQRYYWSYAMPAWSEIEVETKQLWKDYAAAHPQQNSLGETYYLTSLQWFTRCNIRLITWGGSPVTTPPIGAAPETLEPTGLTYQPGVPTPEIWIDFTEGLFAEHWCIIDAYVIPFGQAMSWKATYYRMRSDYEPYGDYWSFLLRHNQKFGVPQTGWQCTVRVYTGDNQGLISPPWQYSAVYPAP